MSKDLSDLMDLTGLVTIEIRDENGKLKDWQEKNTVVTVGKQHVAALIAGAGPAVMSHMAIGTGTTAVALTDTALGAELDRNEATATQGTGADANKVVFIGSWGTGDPAGTNGITEAGLFNNSSGGTMLARVVFAVKNKGESDTLTVTWTITVN